MHDEAFLSVVPFFVWFAGVVAACFLIVIFIKHRHRSRRSPFIRHLLRSPGGAVRQQLDVVDGKIDFYLLQLILSLPLTIVILLGQQNFLPSSLYPLWAGTVVICCLSVAFSSVLFVLILRLLVVQRKLDLDLDCKIAVGQELNLLMRQGCSVFHDVPADGSSIDHVLVGPSGVYVIATKGRVKPRRRKGSLEERVFYDGKELVFPGCNDTGPLLQVKWQAAWFAEWLSGVVGEKVLVKGIVFLPGWTVEASGRNEISVVNEDSAHLLAKPRGDNVLGEDSLQRIAYQIEHHCRIMTGEGG